MKVTIAYSSKVRAVTFSPDSKILVSASTDKTVQLWAIDPVTGTSVFKKAIVVNMSFYSLLFSEDS
jgi:WD40 repeat protein